MFIGGVFFVWTPTPLHRGGTDLSRRAGRGGGYLDFKVLKFSGLKELWGSTLWGAWVPGFSLQGVGLEHVRVRVTCTHRMGVPGGIWGSDILRKWKFKNLSTLENLSTLKSKYLLPPSPPARHDWSEHTLTYVRPKLTYDNFQKDLKSTGLFKNFTNYRRDFTSDRPRNLQDLHAMVHVWLYMYGELTKQPGRVRFYYKQTPVRLDSTTS